MIKRPLILIESRKKIKIPFLSLIKNAIVNNIL